MDVFASREDDYARYCSEACMRCDHEAHRHQVDATQALFESNAAGTIAGPTDSMRLALKVSRCPGGNGEWWERRVDYIRERKMSRSSAEPLARSEPSGSSAQRVTQHVRRGAPLRLVSQTCASTRCPQFV